MRPVPPSPDEIDFTLLDRFLAGECSPAEAEVVRLWLARRDSDARYLNAVRDALQSQDATSTAPNNPDALWDRLVRDTVAAERNVDRLPPPLRLSVSIPRARHPLGRVLATRWVRVAAVVAFVVGAAVTSRFVGVFDVSSVPAPSMATREYATARGERAELRLPDGTRVVLAPDSRLKVPADFAVTERTVSLAGQAYFDVKHDDRKPFLVRAGNAMVHDLGTRFDVRAYAEGRGAVQVVVAEGKVQLAAMNAPLGTGPILGHGEMGRLDTMGAVTTGRANLTSALAWTRGEMVFNDAPLSEVAMDLARLYDLDIRIPDPLLRRKRVTLTLDVESALEAAEAVALLAGVGYERRGQVVIFVPTSSLPETDR